VATQANIAERGETPALDRVLVGSHPLVVKLRALVERVAPTDATTLEISVAEGPGQAAIYRQEIVAP